MKPRHLIFGGMFLVAVGSVYVLLTDAPTWDKWISAGALALAVWVAYYTARQLPPHRGRHRGTYTEIRVPGTGVAARALRDEIQLRVYWERGRWFWRRTRARTVAAAPYRLHVNDTLTVSTLPGGQPPYTVRVNDVPVVSYPDQ